MSRPGDDIRALLDPLAAVRAARPRYRIVPERSATPPATPELPNPESIVTPARVEVFVSPADMPDQIGQDVPLGTQVALIQAALAQLTDQEARSVTGRAAITSGTLTSTVPRRVPVEWDTAPLGLPTDVTAMALPAMPTATGRVSARVDEATITLTGCDVLLASSGTVVVVTTALPVAVEVVGRYIYRPPFQETP